MGGYFFAKHLPGQHDQQDHAGGGGGGKEDGPKAPPKETVVGRLKGDKKIGRHNITYLPGHRYAYPKGDERQGWEEHTRHTDTGWMQNGTDDGKGNFKPTSDWYHPETNRTRQNLPD